MVTKPGIIFLLCVGTLYTTDAAITAWTVPSINTADGPGTLDITEEHGTETALTTFVATGTSPEYTLAQAVSPFELSTGGELTITAALDHETTPTYTLHIVATDSDDDTGTATVIVTVTDVNEFEPVFSAATYSPCIADKSPAGTTLTTVTATDKDTSQTISYDIDTGDTGNDFKIVPSTGLIQVNDDKTLNKTATASYTLVVTAADNVVTIKTATTTVSVTVADSCGDGGNGDNGDKGDSGSAVAVVSMAMLFVSLVVTLF